MSDGLGKLSRLAHAGLDSSGYRRRAIGQLDAGGSPGLPDAVRSVAGYLRQPHATTFDQHQAPESEAVTPPEFLAPARSPTLASRQPLVDIRLTDTDM